jgi:hypothetical protein
MQHARLEGPSVEDHGRGFVRFDLDREGVDCGDLASAGISGPVGAHSGGPGYELEVKAGTPAKGEFTIDSPGSFEVESHHLEKIIVILNAR